MMFISSSSYKVRTKPAILCCGVTCILLIIHSSSFLHHPSSNNALSFLMPLGVVVGKNDAKEEEEEDCLRARNNTIPKYLHGSSYLQPPAINLGLPKMGSTSLQHFFGCAGYGASHWLCGKDQICARCIEASVDDHLPPLEKCGNNGGPIYAQIDGWGTNPTSSTITPCAASYAARANGSCSTPHCIA